MTNLAIIIVSYNSADVLKACVSSFLDWSRKQMIIIVDNASEDHSVSVAKRAQRTYRDLDIHILKSGDNLGFAAGVNMGMRYGLENSNAAYFWILNPDTVVPKQSLRCLDQSLKNSAEFGLMGGRIVYAHDPSEIQSDGAVLSNVTGVTHNCNLGKHTDTKPPNPEDLDFISGASLIASRDFVETVGPISEEYFLYYEEADWAMRGKNFNICVNPHLIVEHAAGHAIGSATSQRRGSYTALFYLYRSRIKFMAKWYPARVPFAFLYGAAKALSLIPRDAKAAVTIFAGLCQLRTVPFQSKPVNAAENTNVVQRS